MPLFLLVPLFMLITGSISAFISSTAVVIVFIKIITELKDKYNISKSKLLLPISFASILGGSCTLMGTSTNLIVNSIYSSRTGQNFAFFEFTWMGIIFLLVGVIIITLLHRFLPADSTEKLTEQYDLDNYIATLELSAGSTLIGKPLHETFLTEDNGVEALKITRRNEEIESLDHNSVLQSGDRIMVSCNLQNLLRLKTNKELILNPDTNEKGMVSRREFKDQKKEERRSNLILVELMMMPRARFLDLSLSELRQKLSNNALPLAIKKRKNLRHLDERIYKYNPDITKLKVGDRVLVEMEKEKIEEFDLNDNIAILQQHEAPEIANQKNRNFTLFVLGLVVLLAATGTLKILTSAILGSVLLLLSNSITLESVYKKINWQIIFLLAGMIPLGIAMHNTGADDWLTSILLDTMQGQNAALNLGILFIVTLLLSGIVSNNATAIIMAPIAISLAEGMNLPAKPFALSILFAANFSFFTPMGYQTNALIYSMGIYKFKHFLILGGAISLILWLLTTYLLSISF